MKHEKFLITDDSYTVMTLRLIIIYHGYTVHCYCLQLHHLSKTLPNSVSPLGFAHASLQKTLICTVKTKCLHLF